ncbi:S8 family serine peptidase [Dysgonomonas sp. 25]|uniref:S8 family serine peptidase n=1 Tax=Dysgonomonas sp. 25 TaxID=2302933 RepID=UPI0013D6F2E3|nr:S8 family serine peptidase [Dysgonomonas sp. 25]NDV70451.1 serine protease [Dysgonomonas sp. 25]
MKKIYTILVSTLLLILLFPACSSDDNNEPLPPPLPEPTPVVDTIYLDYSLKKMLVGDTFLLGVTAMIDSEETSDITWSSSNASVATVDDDGRVRAVGSGVAIVTVSLDAKPDKLATCTVEVVNNSSTHNYKYRLVLRDKEGSGYSVNNPEEFLTPKSIQRRQRQNIAIDATDLPIPTQYIELIEGLGGIVVAKSKWLNTVTVLCTEEYMADEYRALPFVEDVVFVWQGVKYGRSASYRSDKLSLRETPVASKSVTAGIYGNAEVNITPNNGIVLHQAGYKGEGMTIAVLDAGFAGTQDIDFMNRNVKAGKSFVYEVEDVYTSYNHGTAVLSCMAANKANHFVGTAPAADYWLFQTEDEDSEYPVEEDYWVAAAEYADSIGVDLINSSLAYTDYDAPAVSYTYNDMNGRKALASRGADMAVNKGIFVVVSAGNSATWVGTPADGRNVLTVGGIESNGSIYDASSYGVTVDGRMKPDVLALGYRTGVVSSNSGNVGFVQGTSFSSPIMCGLAACLWQANPSLTAKELLQVMRNSGNRASNPVVPFGYGVPDMQRAMQLAEEVSAAR